MTRGTCRCAFAVVWIACATAASPVDWLKRHASGSMDDLGPNLCSEPGVVFSGSLAGESLQRMIDGGPPLREIKIPPQDLVITWPHQVTFDTLRIEWESEDVHGIHYGLEYWDKAANQYRLACHIRDNSAATVVHHFDKVRTARARFTVFEHTLRYDSVVIRSLALHRSVRTP